MMATPEMSSEQEQSTISGGRLTGVPPQAGPADAAGDRAPFLAARAEAPAEGPGAASDSAAFAAERADAPAAVAYAEGPGVARTQAPEPGLPLAARVLLADLGVAAVSLVVLILIGVQRLGDADLHSRRVAYAEDLVLFFAVGGLFALVAYLLFRAGRAKVAAMQAVIAAIVIGLGVFAAATGNPQPAPVTQIEQPE